MDIDRDRAEAERFAVRVLAQVRDHVRNGGDADNAVSGLIIALAKLTDQDEAELGDRIFGGGDGQDGQ